MEAKKLSELVAEFEKSTDETKRELSEIKATMYVNWCKGNGRNPELLDGSEKTALTMFIKIIKYYVKPV